MYSFLKNTHLMQLNNRKKLSKWTSVLFFIILMSAIIAIFNASILEKIINPHSFIDSNKLILEVGYSVNISDKVNIIVKTLKSIKQIKEFNLISDKSVRSIIQEIVDISNVDIPMPTLFNITLFNNTDLTPSDLQLILNQKIEGVTVSSEEEVVNRLLQKLKISEEFILLIPLIMILSIIGVTFFIVMYILYSHKTAIELLYYLGANINIVAREFSTFIVYKLLRSIVYSIVVSSILIGIGLLFSDISNIFLPTTTSIVFMLIIIFILPLLTWLCTFYFIKKFILVVL